MRHFFNDPILAMFLALVCVRLLLYSLMIAIPTKLLRDMDNPRKGTRRKANPSIRQGLAMLASSGVAFSALAIRQVLIRFDEDGTLHWLLFNRDPDYFGELGGAIFSIIAVSGVLLLVRGIRGMIYAGASGELPVGMGPRKD